METCYDVAIVGAGVQGSATAYYLKKKAGVKKVLLLDQFSVLHSRGSSHGHSRITRRAYDQAYYVKMMSEAFPMWSDLERESGSQLYIQTGIVVFGIKHYIRIVSDSLKANEIFHKTFSASEVNQKYHSQLALPSHFSCVSEEDGGILLASKAVDAYQKLFQLAGGELRDNHLVTEIVPGQVVTIKTSKGSFRTRKLVITAGAWAPVLLRKLGVELPFKTVRTVVTYWKVDSVEDFSSSVFPAFIAKTSGDDREFHFYGIPVHEYPGLIKICHHSGPEVTPDNRDADPFAATSTIKKTAAFIGQFFRGVSTTPSIIEPCMYTNSPDTDPVLDRHPQHPNIVFGAGFSGHGFKLSPVIGKILSELALGLTPSYDLSPFKLNRFQKPKL